MDVMNLLLLLGALLLLLLLLVIIYLLNRSKAVPKRPSAEKGAQPQESSPLAFDALEAVILNQQSSQAELSGAVEAICSHHGTIRAATLERYLRLMVALCRHPHTDKSTVIALDRGLQGQNPNFAQELEAALRKGLNSRG